MSSRVDRGKPYICVDVDLPRNERVEQLDDPAGCLGLWTALTCYAREQLTDGRVPKRYAESLWGDKKNPVRLKDMCRVGLLACDDTHYEILRYAPRNQTKSALEESRKSAREYMATKRAREKDVRSNKTQTMNQQLPVVATSTSFSERDQDPDREGGEGVGEGGDGTIAAADLPVPPPQSLPAWAGAVDGAEWMRVYAVAVRKALGEGSTWGFPDQSLGLLEKVIRDHCPDKKRIPAWIEASVATFMKVVRGDDPALWSSYGPKGLHRAFNEQKIKLRAARPERPTPPREPDPVFTPEEREANIRAAAKLLENLGKPIPHE